MRIAAATLAQGLDRQLDLLARALEGRAEAFAGVVKTGRTHLMDAAPVTLGQEVAAWGATVEARRGDLRRAADAMCEVGLGGTAVGTGLNAVRGFREATVARLAELTGLPLRPAADLREAMQSQRCVGTMSSAMRAIALELVRICNDLRLLASGPACGLGELRLPEVAPGSSIMPGKVNPSIPEMVTQVMFLVAGLDGANALALQAGQLELNVFMPLMAFDLDFGLAIMTNAVEVLRERCVAGLEADEAACGRHLAAGGAIATALTPAIGYEKAAELTREALATGTPVRTLVVERGFMEAAEVDHLLDTRRLVDPGSPERS
jgi:aspartate ammonia-lyase